MFGKNNKHNKHELANPKRKRVHLADPTITKLSPESLERIIREDEYENARRQYDDDYN